MTRHALDFFHEYLPFWEMQPADDLGSGGATFVLANPGQIYAVYIASGGTARLDLGESSAEFEVRWFDPAGAGPLVLGDTVAGPGTVSLGAAPGDRDQDWVALLQRL
jgi:hypothetical protein